MNNQYGQPGMPQMQPQMPQMQPQGLIQERNIVLAIVLSIVTCGIYGIYWFIKMTDESNVYATNKSASGGMAFLYTLITCGIYGIYWYYKTGQKMYESGQNKGIDIKDNSIIYLILGVVGLGFVSEILIQADLNKLANA